ncbi:hypothetical protein, partial [Flavobacterium sp.]|uniref:hypothetical protein n=1 Tax=Flavobacterium sp. TaxID=239 RepID=UPI003C69E049
MIEVFCTNITTQNQAAFVIKKLSDSFSNCNFTVDLDDCDKILRVENHKYPIDSNEIIGFVTNLNIEIKVLEDIVITKPFE